MIKILCAEYINLQENLTVAEKIDLLEFVKSGDSKQAAHLLLYGEKVPLEEAMISESNVFDAMQAAHSSNPIVAIKAAYQLKGMKGVQHVAPKFYPYALVAAAVIAASIYVIKRGLSQASKACRKAPDKSKCMAAFKVKVYNTQIAKLKKDSSLCSKTKNPDKCKKKIMDKINKINAQIQKLGNK